MSTRQPDESSNETQTTAESVISPSSAGPVVERRSLTFGAAAREAIRRISGGVGMSLLATPVVAVLEAYWIRGRSAEVVSPWAVWLASVGLLFVPALILGVAIGLASWWLHPHHAPSVSRWRHAMSPRERVERRRLAMLAVLTPVAATGTMALAGQSALAVLVMEQASPATAGALMAGAMAVTAAVLGLVTILVAHIVAHRAPSWTPEPLRWALGGLAMAAAIVGWLVLAGTTSGAGSQWALFGVFKRQELDLRAPAELVTLAMAAYWGAALLRQRFALAAVLAVAHMVALFVTATSTLDRASTALAVERSGAMARRSLAAMRTATDRDGDGFSAWFGGGDCDDTAREINPSVDDIPENGIDEDCSGTDAKKLVLREAVERSKTPEEWIEEKLPDDLRLLLLTVDTLRYDIGFAGYGRNITPNIDKLAAQSTYFTQAYALASYTGKSVGPMLIGKYPSETHREWLHFNQFTHPEDILVAERLQKAGVRTVSVQGYWYFFQERFGINRGFDVIDGSAAPKQVQVEGDRTSTSQAVADAVLAQLAAPENAEGPLFLWAHFTDPHADYVPHEGFDFGRGARDLYDGEVAFVDHQIGRILDAVRSGSAKDRTAIMVTSDHGEAFGEHGMWRHGFELWEPLVRVPWLIHVPGVAAQKIDRRRSLIDLVPTILDLFRLNAPEKGLSGESLLPDVLSPPGHTPQSKIVFIDMPAGPYNTERQAFIENDYKVIAAAGRPLGVYHLTEDPGEERNLLKEPGVADTYIDRYKAFRRELDVVEYRAPK